MSEIKVTREISSRLARLQNTVSIDGVFNRLSQVEFEDNIDFPSLDSYRDIIRTTGNLASRYSQTLSNDTTTCEEFIESIRERDKGISNFIKGR